MAFDTLILTDADLVKAPKFTQREKLAKRLKAIAPIQDVSDDLVRNTLAKTDLRFSLMAA